MAILKYLYRWKRWLHKQWLSSLPAAMANIRRNQLWQRMLKNIICTTITIIIGIIPAVVDVYGTSTYLAPMVTVFGHPGQRFGKMAESLSLITLGVFVGIAWSFLGLYCSSLVHENNIQAAYAIRAVFFVLTLLFHGILRSSTPRLFSFVFFLLLVSLGVLTGSSTTVSAELATQSAYPALTGVGAVILANVLIFPSFSSSFLGTSTIKTLCETMACFQAASDWFTSPHVDLLDKAQADELRAKLIGLADKKSNLRTQLASSRAVQAECNFELVYAVLPPRALKPISIVAMSRFVQTALALVNACESKYALSKDSDESSSPTSAADEDADSVGSNSDSSFDTSDNDSSTSASEEKSRKGAKKKSRHARNLELVKPVREIESGDIELLEHIIAQIRLPVKALQDQMQRAVRVTCAALAYCYDVHGLPSGAPRPQGVLLEEIDIALDLFIEAMSLFDQDTAAALEHAAELAYRPELQGDIMPRMETHLISSFLINQRLAAGRVLAILRHTRSLVERRQARNEWRRFYLPKISWKKWLTTGGEEDANALPENARKEVRAGHGLKEDLRKKDDDAASTSEPLLHRPGDEETLSKSRPKGEIPRRKGPMKAETSKILWLRGIAADVVEFFADSDDLAFALKMTIACFIVTWPAFVPAWTSWYASVRGSWASLQLVLVFEVSIGTTFQGFLLRIFGVIFGCVVGFAAYEIGSGNRIVAVVILVLGVIPSSYFHLGTPYVKTGIISVTSMSVVCFAIFNAPNGDDSWEVFVKRMVCFLVGGTVALLVETFLFPVRARDRLVESLASTIQQISNMQASVAVGVDTPGNINIKSKALGENFTHAKEKAEQALAAARTFLPVTLREPRLKGSFRGQYLIYSEMIFVCFQITERMDNMLHMRQAYGSSVLEEFNAEVQPFRRNVAGSIAITLFAVHEALTTRLPLPQFLPSSRVAQLRYIRRVRELMLERAECAEGGRKARSSTGTSTPLSSQALLKSMTKQNFIAWNAGSAGLMEIIEYLEELVDLAKLLVGVNAFRSGMLERPQFKEYMEKLQARGGSTPTNPATDGALQKIMSKSSGVLRRRTARPGKSNTFEPGEGIRRRQTFSFWGSSGRESVARPPEGRMRPVTSRSNEAAIDTEDEDDGGDKYEDDLPMSLQRVRTKRMEGRELERLRKASSAGQAGMRRM